MAILPLRWQRSSVVEQGTHKPLVGGSNPPAATSRFFPLVVVLHTVYVLRSLRNGRHYVGFTSRSLERRLEEHNRGYPKGWTSHNGPFEVVYQEAYECEREARARERFLKSGRGREWLMAQLAAYPPAAGGDSRRRRAGASPWSSAAADRCYQSPRLTLSPGSGTRGLAYQRLLTRRRPAAIVAPWKARRNAIAAQGLV